MMKNMKNSFAYSMRDAIGAKDGGQKECTIIAAATWNTLNRKSLKNRESCDEDKKGYLNEKKS